MDADGLQECFTSVLVEAELERAANTMAVAAAVYAGVSIADRLRAAVGHEVTLLVGGATVGEPLTGTLVDATETSATLSRPGRRWIVRLGAVELVRGLPPSHRRAQGLVQERLGLAAQVRPLVGEQVVVAVAGETVRGVLRRVGADHLEVGPSIEAAVIPFQALRWVCVDA